MQTSRGCLFRCKYCHISKEGDAAKLRLKSFARVIAEVDLIKKLGVEYMFFEDGSLLAKRERIKKIFHGLRGKGLKVIDVNGVNPVHFFHGAESWKGKLKVDVELLRLMKDVGWVGWRFRSSRGASASSTSTPRKNGPASATTCTSLRAGDGAADPRICRRANNCTGNRTGELTTAGDEWTAADCSGSGV